MMTMRQGANEFDSASNDRETGADRCPPNEIVGPSEKPKIDPAQLESLDIRVGIVRSAAPLRKARVPAFALEIDFGPLGMKQSSARLTRRYTAEQLIGRRIVAVVNLPSRRVAGYRSDVLVLGAVRPRTTGTDAESGSVDSACSGHIDDVSLLAVDHPDIPPGTPIA